jgi:ribosome-associated toxin RatA of RatAB toxin-antitoxin module
MSSPLLHSQSIGFKAFTETYISRVTLSDPRAEPKSIVARAVKSSIFEELRSKWTFEQDMDRHGRSLKRTNVCFAIDFKVSSQIHAQAVDLFFRDVANTQLQAFEKRCEQLFGHEELVQDTSSFRSKNSVNAASTNTFSTSQEQLPGKYTLDLELLVPSLAPFGKKMNQSEMTFLADVFHRHATRKHPIYVQRIDTCEVDQQAWLGEKRYLSVSEFRAACAELTSFDVFTDIASNPVSRMVRISVRRM